MNQNDCSGKTLKPRPVFVDHYTLAPLTLKIKAVQIQILLLQLPYSSIFQLPAIDMPTHFGKHRYTITILVGIILALITVVI